MLLHHESLSAVGSPSESISFLRKGSGCLRRDGVRKKKNVPKMTNVLSSRPPLDVTLSGETGTVHWGMRATRRTPREARWNEPMLERALRLGTDGGDHRRVEYLYLGGQADVEVLRLCLRSFAESFTVRARELGRAHRHRRRGRRGSRRVRRER